MELIRTLLVQQPLMALFLTIAIGYLVGEINVKDSHLVSGPFCSSLWPSAGSRRSRLRRRWLARWDWRFSSTP